MKNCQKLSENKIFFEQIACFERDLLESQMNHSCRSFLQSNESNLLASLLYKEEPKQMAHSHSFVISDLSNLLTVALFSIATRVNRSPSLFNLSDFERKSEVPTLEKLK